MTVLLAYTVSISIVRDKEVMNINPHTSYDNESVLPSSNLKVYTIYVSSEGNTHVHMHVHMHVHTVQEHSNNRAI